MKNELTQPGFTCDQCRWKAERNECPDGFFYEGTDYAEDCDNFRYVGFEQDAFK